MEAGGLLADWIGLEAWESGRVVRMPSKPVIAEWCFVPIGTPEERRWEVHLGPSANLSVAGADTRRAVCGVRQWEAGGSELWCEPSQSSMPADPSAAAGVAEPEGRSPATFETLWPEVIGALAAQRRQAARGERLVVSTSPSSGRAKSLAALGFEPAGTRLGAPGPGDLWQAGAALALGGTPRHLPRGRRIIRVKDAWDGAASDLPDVQLALEFGPSELRVWIDAPFFGDPAPSVPPGSCPGLWEHEVVELFLLGDNEEYLELEFGPLGHYLVLYLRGRRQVLAQGMALDYQVQQQAGRVLGQARVPRAWWPPGLARFNAYAISGQGAGRRYRAHRPQSGARPDFHQLETFAALSSLAADGVE